MPTFADIFDSSSALLIDALSMPAIAVPAAASATPAAFPNWTAAFSIFAMSR
jgi:hypothetical protein